MNCVRPSSPVVISPKVKKFSLPMDKREFAHRGAECVTEGRVWQFEGVDPKAVAVETCDHVLVRADQDAIQLSIFAYHLLEALKIALGPRQVGSFALSSKKSIVLQLYWPHGRVRRERMRGLASWNGASGALS